MSEASHSTSASAADETCTLAYGNVIIQFFQERTLANCAGFFLPHLRPGMSVLYCGCGPGSLTIEIAERVAPDRSAAVRLGALYPRVMAHHGGNRLRAPLLRGALLEAGFTRVEGYAGAEVAGTPEQLHRFAAGWADVALGSSFRTREVTDDPATKAMLDAFVATRLA